MAAYARSASLVQTQMAGYEVRKNLRDILGQRLYDGSPSSAARRMLYNWDAYQRLNQRARQDYANRMARLERLPVPLFDAPR